jgi:protein TonB
VAAAAGRFFPPGPTPREVWLTLGLSVLIHGLLTVAVVMIPRFQVGTYIQVPVSYTVSLVSAPPGGSEGSPPAAARPVVPPAPAQVAPAPAVRPAPQPAPRPTEELTLPGRRAAPKRTQDVEPSLRPPSVIGKETPRPAPPVPAPAAPVTPTTPQRSAPVASAPVGAGIGKASGVEVAGTTSGAGSGPGGVSALASYLTRVDWKIQQNWVPVGASSSPETVVVVRFRVLPSGQVRDVDLETSSGNASVDTSALRAVRQSIPLPPFPNLLSEPYLDLRYRFVMEHG